MISDGFNFFARAWSLIASLADALLARHAIFPLVGEERLREEPKRAFATEARPLTEV